MPLGQAATSFSTQVSSSVRPYASSNVHGTLGEREERTKCIIIFAPRAVLCQSHEDDEKEGGKQKQKEGTAELQHIEGRWGEGE
jgi:hypothetical protein